MDRFHNCNFTMLINVMLVHGYMPDDMLASVLRTLGP